MCDSRLARGRQRLGLGAKPAVAGLAIVALGACYAPSISGRRVPCDPDHANCLLGERCAFSEGRNICLGPGDVAVDAAVDAADDAPVRRSYAAIVLADLPSGYWRLGDMTGVAVDASGHGATGSYGSGVMQGVPGAIVGDADTAVEIGGQTGAISVGSGFEFTGTAAFSIEAWIRPSLLDDEYRHVFTTQLRTPPWQGYALLLHRAEGIKFERFVADRPNSVVVGTQPSAASFTHIVATYDGAAMHLYVNGQLAKSVLESRPQPVFTQPTVIGAASLTEAFFDGSIDEVAVYPAALTAARVQAHHLAGTAP